jgi:hypothetical protein
MRWRTARLESDWLAAEDVHAELELVAHMAASDGNGAKEQLPV